MAVATTALVPTGFPELLRAELARRSVPGMAVGLLRDGERVTLAAGVAGLETGFPVLADTRFQIGSITKIVTTTLVMQLVDEGRVALDAPIAGYLPALQLSEPAATQSLTMRHLLTHTGGFFGDRFADYGAGEDALARAVADFSGLRQYTRPGELWMYSNLGFQLAGRVAEHLLGAPFEALVRERIFAPLGMDASTFFAEEAISYPVAAGHLTDAAGTTTVTHAWAKSRCRNPQGGMLATVGDLLRFAQAHLDGGALDGVGIVSAASAAAMQRPQVAAIQAPHWGLGWWVDTVDGETIVGHGGVTNGFQAQLTLVPGRGTAFAFLSNGSQGGAAIRELETWLLGSCLRLRRVEPAAHTLPESRLRRLAGRYAGALARCSVQVNGDRLRLLIEKISPYTHQTAPPVEMSAEPIDERRFRFVDGVDQGTLFDFIDAASDDYDAPPRFLRLNNRLLDREE